MSLSSSVQEAAIYVALSVLVICLPLDVTFFLFFLRVAGDLHAIDAFSCLSQFMAQYAMNCK